MQRPHVDRSPELTRALSAHRPCEACGSPRVTVRRLGPNDDFELRCSDCGARTPAVPAASAR